MKIPSNILHDKQYADKILEITADTMFFVYKDGTCLDFKANTTDFFIKEQDIIGRNIFSYFPVETAREMYAEFIKVRAGDKPSARNTTNVLSASMMRSIFFFNTGISQAGVSSGWNWKKSKKICAK